MAELPSEIWDAFNLDLIIRVLELSFLHPLFSMWTPVLARAQNYTSTSLPYRLSVAYFLLTIILSLFPFTSNAYTNRAWRSKSWVTAFFGGPSLDWDAQVVMVTGGAGGIGSVLVGTLAMMGATVVVVDQVEIKPEWDDVYSYACDLSVEEEIQATVKKIQEEVGHPTILIQNAGTVQGKLLVDLTPEEVKQTFAVNVLAQFSLIRLLLPEMIKQKRGHVVTISSVFGLASGAQLGDYAASKHALVALHDTLRLELRHRHGDPPIRTTLVCPGRVLTPLFESVARPSAAVAFLAPTVKPYALAKAIVAALDTEQSREIYLPRYGAWLWATKGLPSWARAWLEHLSGANEAMLTWKKAERKEKDKVL